MHYYFAGLAVSALIVLFFIVNRPRPKRADWHEHMGFWSPRPIMRRWRNGKWEYRDLNSQEWEDYQDSTIW